MVGETEEAGVDEDVLRFRGFRFPILSQSSQIVEGKGFCVCYLNPQAEGFEKAIEQIYKLKEQLTECQFVILVKGLKTKLQLAELAKKAYYLQRLNIFTYRSGFHKFMTRTEREPHCCVFFDAAGQPANVQSSLSALINLADSTAGNQSKVINPLNFEDAQVCQTIAQAYNCSALRKEPALFQINKPARNKLVYNGTVFNSNLVQTEYLRQRAICIAFLVEKQ